MTSPRSGLLVVALLLLSPLARAGEQRLEPVALEVGNDVAQKLGAGGSWVLEVGGSQYPAQWDASARRLHAILPAFNPKTGASARLKNAPAASTFSFKDEGDVRLHLSESDRPVLAYNFGMVLKPGAPEDRRRSSYVHPLYAPDGTLLTEDFPKDHLHHRGVSWMWPNIDVDGEKVNLWEIVGIHQRFDRWVEKSSGPVYARIACENGWYTGKRRVAKEEVTITVYRAVAGTRAMDVTLVIEALGSPLKIGGTLTENKGYGGFSLRFGPRKEKTTVITTSAGVQKQDSNLLPFPWADLSASFDGSAGIHGGAIFVDASHPDFPKTGWTLREYGFLGVAWPGLSQATFAPGKPVKLRYRVWMHSGTATQAGVAEAYKAYAAKPVIRIE